MATDNQPPANSSSSLRGMVARYPATAFLVMVFGFGRISLIPMLLSENGLGVLPIELPLTVVQRLATLLGMALPAFLVTAATGGKEGVRDLLRRLLRWRVGVHWYLIALFGLLVAMVLAAIPFLGVVPLEALAQKWGLLVQRGGELQGCVAFGNNMRVCYLPATLCRPAAPARLLAPSRAAVRPLTPLC